MVFRAGSFIKFFFQHSWIESYHSFGIRARVVIFLINTVLTFDFQLKNHKTIKKSKI